jgi:hypothetical protein
LLPNHENETCWKNGGQKRPSSNRFIHFFKLLVKPASPAVKKRGWPNEVGDHTARCRACWSAAKSIPRSFLECI